MTHEPLQSNNQGTTAAVAVDVGGTTTRAALVNDQGLVRETTRTILSQADGPLDVILTGFLRLIRQVIGAASHTHDVQALGIGFPGPCDYRSGTALMRHKFASLHGVALREVMAAETGLVVVFLNDADAFALGAWQTEFASTDRLLGITLGTGIGSGFVIEGALATGGEGVPHDGDIWNLPFRDRSLEHFACAAAISRSYGDRTGRLEMTVKEIAERAHRGSASALSVFSRFGSDLGEGVGGAVQAFDPDRIVLGGQISKAFDLFGPRARTAYSETTGNFVPWSPVEAESVELVGAGHVALDRLRA